MDDKRYLINAVKKSELPEEVKKDLLQKIASQGATFEIANEIADLLDMQADVLEISAHIEEKQAQAYEELANKLQQN